MTGVSRTRSILAGLLLGLSAIATEPSQAADLPTEPKASLIGASAPDPFFVRLGASGAFPDVDVRTSIAGTAVADGNSRMDPVPAAYFEAGYYLTRNVALSLSGGFPPTLTARGTGSFAAQGVLYRAVAGLPVFAVTYHLETFGRVRPYAGVGVGYGIVFRSEAAAVLNPLLRNEAAFVLVAGVDYDVTTHWGVFVDVKKAFLTQRFTGTAQVPVAVPGIGVVVARLPAEASVRTDPVLVTLGLSYRF